MPMTSFSTHFDSFTPEKLRKQGYMKWSRTPDTLGMWVAEMDFGIAPQIKDALISQAETGSFGYLPASERSGIATSAAAWFNSSFNAHLNPEWTFLIPEILEGLRQVLAHLTRPGTPVIVPTPAYIPFLTIPAEFNREVIQVPSYRDSEGFWRLDFDGIRATFEQGAELFILCNPWNPVGRSLNAHELSSLAEIVDEHGGIVFEDAIHAPLTLSGSTYIPYVEADPRAARHTVTAFAASKGWNIPGLKCAQMSIHSKELWDRFSPVASRLVSATSTLGARISRVAYEEAGEWMAEVRSYLSKNRDLLLERVSSWEGVELSPVEGTYIAFIDFSARKDVFGAKNPADAIRELGKVDLTDGSACGRGYEDFARMIFACPRPILLQALDRIEELLR